MSFGGKLIGSRWQVHDRKMAQLVGRGFAGYICIDIAHGDGDVRNDGAVRVGDRASDGGEVNSPAASERESKHQKSPQDERPLESHVTPFNCVRIEIIVGHFVHLFPARTGCLCHRMSPRNPHGSSPFSAQMSWLL